MTEPGPDTAAAATAHYRRGNGLKDAGRLAEALAAYDAALALNGAYPQALCNRGVVLLMLGRPADALAGFDRATALAPRDAIAHYNRASALYALGRAGEAIDAYAEVTRLDPGFVQAWLLRGNLLRERGEAGAALDCFSAAVAARPDFAEGWYNRGLLMLQAGKAADAVADFDRALAANPGLAQAAYSRGNALRGLGDSAGAVASYQRALALQPDYPEAWANLGALQGDLGRHEEAVASLDRALALRPGDARSLCSRATALSELRQTGAALAGYDAALAVAPDMPEAHYNRALTLLLRGDYAAGWREYEWRWSRAQQLSIGAARTYRQPLWLGREDIAGRRLLLWAEQGLGDTLQFCRYASLARERGAHVTLEVQPALVELLRSLDGVERIVPEGAPPGDFDYHCPLMSLPLAFGTTVATIPARRAYLRADPARIAAWSARLGPRTAPRIGLAWRGNPAQGGDAERSLPLAQLLPMLPGGFQYVSLQKDLRADDAATLRASDQVLHVGDGIRDFGDTAALCACLDAVLSVCTSVAHLAGAVGADVRVLLRFHADWRWLDERSDSPWYPTARLYRQGARGDWAGVLDRVGADLRRDFGGGA